MAETNDLSVDEQIHAAQRLIKVKQARESLLAFTHLTMPHPEDPGNVNLSLYQEAVHHRLIAEALEKVEKGLILRLIITMPPRHGKSELASRRFPAWCQGRNPHWQQIFAAYGADFAQDFGRDVRNIMNMPVYLSIFPGVGLRRDSQASDRLQTTQNGLLVFVGAGGAITGRGADLLTIDDPFKNKEDADSPAMRKKVWEFFTSTAYTRLMPGGRIVIIMTRCHEDDLVGRIFDENYVKPEEAAKYTVLDLPAIHDGQALWAERYPLEVLESIRNVIGPRDWSALYQQKPTPEDGDYYRREWIEKNSYLSRDLPANLRNYGASDHALTTKEENDANVLGVAGVDERDHIYIRPDLTWERMETDDTVEALLGQLRRHRPQIWFAEDEHIRKAIGPFLNKRMQEEKLYTYIQPSPATKDAKTRGRSMQGRMQMGMVHLPRDAPWYPQALEEMLKFPNGKHDDFVSFMSHLGMGLDTLQGAKAASRKPKPGPVVGSIEWVKAAHKHELRQKRLRTAIGGM